MSVALQAAEERVGHLIEETNRAQGGSAGHQWTYELTTEVDNIGIRADSVFRRLLVNPSWLCFVVSMGEFKACVADEIVAWHLIQALTAAF